MILSIVRWYFRPSMLVSGDVGETHARRNECGKIQLLSWRSFREYRVLNYIIQVIQRHPFYTNYNFKKPIIYVAPSSVITTKVIGVPAYVKCV